MFGFVLVDLLAQRYELTERELRAMIPRIPHATWDPWPGGALKPLLYMDEQAVREEVARKAERALEHMHEGTHCGKCEGSGMVAVTRAAHDPECDGRCINCPVPVPDLDTCPACHGYG